MRRRGFILGIFAISIIIVGACAKVGAPSGGPKDVLPPVVLESFPENGSTSFTGKKFTITFDEYVKIDQVSEKLMTSPPLSKKPDVSMKGKSVIVEFEDELRDSTTYTFYFQDAIKDLNEGNAIENFQYVFSTGDVVDSLSVKGFVYNSLSLNPPEAALVALYRNTDDTAFLKLLPDYITTVLKDGSFRIDNIREGKYNVFALVDQDNSKNYNITDESLAFIDSLIVISSQTNYYYQTSDIKTDTALVEAVDSLSALTDFPDNDGLQDSVQISGNNWFVNYELLLFQPEKTTRYMTSASRSSSYNLSFTLSLPPDSNSFDFALPDVSPDNYLIERNVAKDTMIVWLLDTALSNMPIIKPLVTYPFTDSTGVVVQKTDTVSLRYSAPRTTGNKRIAATPAATSTSMKISSNFSSGAVSPLSELKFIAETPFDSIDVSKIKLYEAKDAAKIGVSFKLESDGIHLRELCLKAELKQGVEYAFVTDSAAFVDVRKNVSDSTGYKISLNTDDKYGKIIFRITGYDGSKIIQLLSQKEDKILREIYSSDNGDIEIPYLDKGTYRVKVIYDFDNDKKWTTGDYYTKKQPEPVSFFSEDIEVKVNWEQIYDWDISVQNFKKDRIVNDK